MFKKYTCNDNYFLQDTAEVFYWAGFIAADGWIELHNKRYKRLGIELAAKDNSLLQEFKKAVDFNGPTRKRTRGKCNSAGIIIRSDQLFNDLARFNIVLRKTHIYTFPEWLIEHPLVNHFMRGYNDGDGSFYINKAHQLCFCLRGTEKFLETFDDILKTNCCLEKNKKPRLNSGTYMLEFVSTRKVCKIRDFLYKNSMPKIQLERKYNIVYGDRFINLPKDFRFKPAKGTNMITGEEIMLESIKEGEEFGFAKSGICSCCKGKSAYHKGYTWEYI